MEMKGGNLKFPVEKNKVEKTRTSTKQHKSVFTPRSYALTKTREAHVSLQV